MASDKTASFRGGRDSGRLERACPREGGDAPAPLPVIPAKLVPGNHPAFLDPVRPAARQIAAGLAGERGLAAIHIVANGTPGRVDFSAGQWSAETMVKEVHCVWRQGPIGGFTFTSSTPESRGTVRCLSS